MFLSDNNSSTSIILTMDGTCSKFKFFALSFLSYTACMYMHRATLFYLYLKNKETEEESLRNLPNVILLLSESIRNQSVLILYALLVRL